MHHFNKLDDDESKEITVICHSGTRAGTAAKELVKEGYTDVTVLQNGMIGWHSVGY